MRGSSIAVKGCPRCGGSLYQAYTGLTVEISCITCPYHDTLGVYLRKPYPQKDNSLPCKNCGATFAPARVTAVFCGLECRRAFGYRARQERRKQGVAA